jgi:hypothetical protein
LPDDRLFHPKLLQSEKVERLTDFERGVWFASRLACDDFGVFRAAANILQGAARFLETKPAKTIHRALIAIDRVGLLQSFEHEGRAFMFQWDWQDWQKVTYPRGTLLPKPGAEMLAICSPATQELFAKHPGGWGRKKQEPFPERLENVSETVREHSENVSLKPLAVSRKPLAGSREPVAVTPAAADARSKHPVYRSDRFVVFEWQFDELSKMLGPHFEGFGMDEFFDALTQQSRADGLVIPRADVWDWLQARVLAEAKRRNLPIASASTAPSADDRKAREQAQNERILAQIQQDRVARAGR